jgi:twitching motility protein PilT
MEQSLMQLMQKRIITVEEATREASNPADFTLRLSGISSASDKHWDGFEARGERRIGSQIGHVMGHGTSWNSRDADDAVRPAQSVTPTRTR